MKLNSKRNDKIICAHVGQKFTKFENESETPNVKGKKIHFWKIENPIQTEFLKGFSVQMIPMSIFKRLSCS